MTAPAYQPAVHALIKATLRTGYNVEAIRSRSRQRSLAAARMALMHVLRQRFPLLSNGELAVIFERDATTIWTATHKAAKRIETDSAFAAMCKYLGEAVAA